MSIYIFLHVWSTHLDTLEKCACRFLHPIIDILNLFRRGPRKFCQRGSNSAPLTIYFFRGERIQIPLKAGQHRPASKTPFNSSLALRITGSPDPLSPLWIRASHDVEHPTYIGEGVSAGGGGLGNSENFESLTKKKEGSIG